MTEYANMFSELYFFIFTKEQSNIVQFDFWSMRLTCRFYCCFMKYFNGRLKVNATSENTDDYHYDNWMTLVSQLPLLLFTLLNSFLYQW